VIRDGLAEVFGVTERFFEEVGHAGLLGARIEPRCQHPAMAD
jgi:hypothetical protein